MCSTQGESEQWACQVAEFLHPTPPPPFPPFLLPKLEFCLLQPELQTSLSDPGG